MQKKIIALAIAAAISTPAFADNANVTFYGKIIAEFESVKSDIVATPATQATSLKRVTSNATRFGIKGEEDLGEGLKGIFQLEAQFDETGTVSTAPFNGVRNSQVGLKGDFGTVFLGNWDTPYKLSHNKVELFDNTTIFSATNLIGRPTNGAATSFVVRKANVMQYWSPNWSGFDVKVAYSPDNAQTATQNKTVMSLSATYENDMFYAAAATESHADEAVAGTTNSANRLVGAYKMGHAGLVGVTVEKSSIKTAGGVDNSVTGTELMASYKFGNSSVGASYAKMGDFGAVVDTGATQISLRYGYSLSKRTELYAAYVALKNKAAGNYDFSSGTKFTPGIAGANLTGLGFGVQHSF